jgi:hypothetical protein
MRKRLYIALMVGGLALNAGCFSKFNPDERQYPCEQQIDCILGYACVQGVGPSPSSESGPTTVCARECDDNPSTCPSGFTCVNGTSVGDASPISVCVSIDESEAVDLAIGDFGVGVVPDSLIDNRDASGDASMDAGFQLDMDMECRLGGCGTPETDAQPTTGACSVACEQYCARTQDECGVPCSVNQCRSSCESNGNVSEIVTLGTQDFGCDLTTQEGSSTSYEELGVLCTEFCQELSDYLIDPINGAGAVCGEYLRCEQETCISACRAEPIDFSLRLGAIMYGVTHSTCPLDAQILGSANNSAGGADVKNLCIPCASTCGVLFPGPDANNNNREFWCGIAQRGSPCPAVNSRAQCMTQCGKHPEAFFVEQSSEICGNLSNDSEPSVIAARAPLCGAQCQSTNTFWGDTASFSESPPTLSWERSRYEIDSDFRICFRESQWTGNPGSCSLVMEYSPHTSLTFHLSLSPITTFEEQFRYAAKLTAQADAPDAEDLFEMAIFHNNDMLLRESFSTLSFVRPLLTHGDVVMFSRTINDTRSSTYRMEFTVNVSAPSSLIINYLSIGTPDNIDSSCQNQCFARSGDDFCNAVCDPDRGLMSACARNVSTPRAPGIPFTSNLSASGQPMNSFCATGDTFSEDFLAMPFDSESCFRECERNRCDLQYQINAIWQPGSLSEGGACHRLNFGGFMGWQSDLNAPTSEGAAVANTRLCCLCSQAYCDSRSLTSDAHDCSQ